MTTAADLPALIETLKTGEEGDRVRASDQIAGLAEQGVDLTSAYPALAGALGDSAAGARVNASWTLAYLAHDKKDITAVIGACIQALGDDHDDVRYNMGQTVQNQLAGEETRDSTLAALEEGLKGDTWGKRANAALQLTLDRLVRKEWDAIGPLFESDDQGTRFGAMTAVAQAAEGGAEDAAVVAPALPLFAKALSDPDAEIRHKAAYGLVSISDCGVDLTGRLPEIAAALLGGAESVRRELVLALWNHVSAERDAGPAAEALEASRHDKSQSVRGNGSIALAIHLLQAGKPEKAAKLLENDDPSVRFGAAWGHAEHRIRHNQLRELADQMKSDDLELRNGVAAAIVDATEKGRDVTPANEAMALARKEIGDDPLKDSQLIGILMQVNQKLKG